MAATTPQHWRARPSTCDLARWGWLCTMLWLSAPTLQAQVVRCQDPTTGALTYTDGACASGQNSRQVTPARSAAERAQDEARSQSARLRWEQEQARAEEQRKAAPDATVSPTASSPAAPMPQPATASACLEAQQTLQTLLNTPTASSGAVATAQRNMEAHCLSPETSNALEQHRATTGESSTTFVPIYVPTPAMPHHPPGPYGARPGTTQSPHHHRQAPQPPAAAQPPARGKIQNVY